MMSAISQNTAVNIYECYFDGLEGVPVEGPPAAKTVQCFRYPSRTEKTAAAHICFSPEGGHEMVVAYADKTFQARQVDDPASYIWNVGKPKIYLFHYGKTFVSRVGKIFL